MKKIGFSFMAPQFRLDGVTTKTGPKSGSLIGPLFLTIPELSEMDKSVKVSVALDPSGPSLSDMFITFLSWTCFCQPVVFFFVVSCNIILCW